MKGQRFIKELQKKLVLERSLEILAIFITVIIGFLSHRRNFISIEFLINFLSFSISWIIITLLAKPNFKNLIFLSVYSVSFGALVRSILLLNSSIQVSFVIVFWIFQTMMLYIANFIIRFIK